MVREKRRIAFFGGSFDPIHSGHLEMARAASAALQLHQVCFVPAMVNPLKEDAPRATPEQRLEMLRLAIRYQNTFSVWEGELSRIGPSYTLHSVEHIERVYPNSHLFWIIGSDQLARLPEWHGIRQLVGKIGFILVRRPGFGLKWPAIPGLSLYPVENDLHPVSATDVRERLKTGRPVTGLVPREVEAYIRENRLYA